MKKKNIAPKIIEKNKLIINWFRHKWIDLTHHGTRNVGLVCVDRLLSIQKKREIILVEMIEITY